MQVIHEPGLDFISVDTSLVEFILHAVEASPYIVDELRIHIRTKPLPHEPECIGYADAVDCEIHIFTGAQPLLELNNTLLHELHHIITHGYYPCEKHLPYDDRPSEIAACTFANEYEASHVVISFPWKARLVAWWQHQCSDQILPCLP